MAVPVGDSFSAVGQLEAADEAAKRNWLASTYNNLINSLAGATQRRMVGEQQAWQQDYYDRALKERQATDTFTLRQASDAADQGLFGAPEDVQKAFPNLRPNDANVLTQRSLAARRAIEDEYNMMQSAADVLNRKALVSRYIPLSEESIRDAWPAWTRNVVAGVIPWMGSGRRVADAWMGGDVADYEKERVAGWKSELERLAPEAARIQGNKQLFNALTLDPETGQYRPGVTAPSWLNQGRTSTPIPTPSPVGAGAGAPAAAAAPTAPAATPPTAQPQFEPAFYNRVNALIAAGMTPQDAKRTALEERMRR